MKEFLSRNNVPFAERDVRTDPQAIDELRRLGAMMTPVTVIDGQQVLGFDEPQLRNLLGLNQQKAA